MPATHEIWLKTDLKRPITVQTLHGLLFSADNQGDKVGFEVYEDGVPVTLSGVITGYIIKANNETVTVSGSFEGNKAWIVCPANAYDAIGPIYIAIKNRASTSSTAITTTLGMCTTYVQRTATGDIVTPTYKIIDAATIATMITQMETATTAANTAATNANNKANAANTAATNANEKASLANTAATNANTAKDNANAAADAANAAAEAAPTTITQQETAYANSINGTTVPTDGWQPSQPTTPQGQYLWIRKTLTWDNGQTTTLYNVSRMGIDGSGSVSSVNSLSPDANGNVDLGVIVHKVNDISPDSSGNVALPIDDAPTAGSSNLVTSGGIKTALDKKIASLGENLITSVSDDTVAYWLSKGPGYVYFDVADCLHGQPYRYGFLVSYVRGPNVYQEFYSTNDFTGPYYRFANTSQTAMPSFEAKTKEGNITFASGIATSSDTRYPTKVYRNGNVICLQAAVQTTDDSNFSNTYRELFTLPVGYRPAYRIMAAGCVGNSIWNQTFAAKINIESGGAVSVYIPANSATNANMCQFCVSFIV